MIHTQLMLGWWGEIAPSGPGWGAKVVPPHRDCNLPLLLYYHVVLYDFWGKVVFSISIAVLYKELTYGS